MEDGRSTDATESDSGLPSDDELDVTMGEGDDLDNLTFTEEEVDEATARTPAAPAPAPQAGDAVPKAAPSEPAAPAKPADGTAAPAAAPAAPAGAPAPAPAAASGPQPFSIRADRATHAFEGAELRDDGLFIPKGTTLDRVQKLLGAGIAHEGSFQRTLASLHQRAQTAEQAVTRAKAEVNTEVERARAQNQFWAELMEKGPDAIAEHLDNFEKTRSLIETRIERATLQREKEALLGLKGAPSAAGEAAPPATAGDDAPVEIDDVQLRGQVPGLLDDLIASTPEFKLLTDADKAELIEHLGSEAMLPRVFFVAKQDYPDKGIFRGDVLADTEVLAREAKRIARVRSESAAAIAADARNQARLRPGAPPVPAGGGSGGGSGDGAPARRRDSVKQTFKTKAEFDEYFANTPIDQQIVEANARKRG